jgi:hypothetical protein
MNKGASGSISSGPISKWSDSTRSAANYAWNGVWVFSTDLSVSTLIFTTLTPLYQVNGLVRDEQIVEQ